MKIASMSLNLIRHWIEFSKEFFFYISKFLTWYWVNNSVNCLRRTARLLNLIRHYPEPWTYDFLLCFSFVLFCFGLFFFFVFFLTFSHVNSGINCLENALRSLKLMRKHSKQLKQFLYFFIFCYFDLLTY